MASQEKLSAIKNENERKFAEVFFDHDEWESQPERLVFSGFTYRPDFLDKKRNVYIEVVGTRQAMSQGRAKYVKAFETLPEGAFELRNPDGQLVNLHYIPTATYNIMDEIRASEQRAKDLFRALREKRNLTYEEVGRRAFPKDHDPAGRVKSLIEGDYGISMVDFLLLCNAFEHDYQEVIHNIIRHPMLIMYPNAEQRSLHNELDLEYDSFNGINVSFNKGW
jgi:hypothetical protein